MNILEDKSILQFDSSNECKYYFRKCEWGYVLSATVYDVVAICLNIPLASVVPSFIFDTGWPDPTRPDRPDVTLFYLAWADLIWPDTTEILAHFDSTLPD